MDLGIKGRTAFVTGGAGTLGRAIAQRLAREGVRVAVCDVSPQALEPVLAQLRAEAYDVIGCVADVTDRGQVDQAVAETVAAFGPIDILVNNAGFSRDRYLTRMSEEDWDSVLDVTLRGAFHCSRSVLPAMMERRFGRVVNIASRAWMGNPGQTNYSAAKAGLIGFTRSLAQEAGRFDITANAVAPGIVSSPRLRARADYPALVERARNNTPIQRLGEPEDVACTVAFLASALAGFITGETIHVAGGR